MPPRARHCFTPETVPPSVSKLWSTAGKTTPMPSGSLQLAREDHTGVADVVQPIQWRHDPWRDPKQSTPSSACVGQLVDYARALIGTRWLWHIKWWRRTALWLGGAYSAGQVSCRPFVSNHLDQRGAPPALCKLANRPPPRTFLKFVLDLTRLVKCIHSIGPANNARAACRIRLRTTSCVCPTPRRTARASIILSSK